MSEAGIDFKDLMERGLDSLTTTIRTGAKVKGVVTMIGKDTMFVDVGARMDGVIDRKDLEDGKGELKVNVGDTVEAFCMGWSDEGIKLTVKISGDMVDSSIEQAFKSHIPVEGKVTGVRKGGYSVQVSNVEGFCPLSQIDGRGVKRESGNTPPGINILGDGLQRTLCNRFEPSSPVGSGSREGARSPDGQPSRGRYCYGHCDEADGFRCVC